jgi:hypothetical protein
MKTKTQRILAIMHVVAWFIFIGLCIQTGAMLISFVVSLYNPVAAKNLYMGLNFFSLEQYDHDAYITVACFAICICAAKAFITYLTILIFMKINLSNPFSDEVAGLVQRISIVAFVTGLFAIIAASYSDWLIKKGVPIPYDWAAGELLLLAGVIFVIAQVFKRGMELQAENDLTV